MNRELSDLESSSEFKLKRFDDSFERFEVTLQGPESSPYKGMEIEMNVPTELRGKIHT